MFFSVSHFWMKIVGDLEGLYLFTRMVPLILGREHEWWEEQR